MAENRKFNWFERTFGRPSREDKLTALALASLLSLWGFCGLHDWYTKKQAERRDFLEKAGIEQAVQEDAYRTGAARFYDIPTMKDVYPEQWQALQNSATNPSMPYMDANLTDEFGGDEKAVYKGLIYDPKTKTWNSPGTIKAPENPAPKKEQKQYDAPKIKNNNPGNLRPVYDKRGKIVKWKGQIGVKNGFCVFDTLENGIRAMGRNLQDYDKIYGRNTLVEIIERWAPYNENNTRGYIARVSQETGYHPNQELNIKDRNVVTNLIVAMTRQEHSKDVPRGLVERSIRGIYN